MVLAVACCALLACGPLNALGEALEPYTPTLSFKDLSLRSIDFTQIEVDFLFAIDNPNPISVTLDTFSYRLGLADVEILTGTQDQGVRLESRGQSELALPVTLAFADIFKLVDSASGKDTLAFSIAGDFGFKTPVGMARIPYREAGAFPVVRPPEVALQGLRLGEVDLFRQRASVKVDIALGNPSGGSTVGLSGLNYTVALGAQRVAGGLMQVLPEVAAGDTQTLTVPLDLDLRALGGAIVAAITQKKTVDVRFAATMQVKTPFGEIPLSIDESGNLTLR